MEILNQDHDRTYNVQSVYPSTHKFNGVLMGFNVYGKVNSRNYLLGTYDSLLDAEQVTAEIKKLMAKGITEYTMPETSDIDELDIYEMMGCNGQ